MTDREKAILWLNSFAKTKEFMVLVPKTIINLIRDELEKEQPVQPLEHEDIRGFEYWRCGNCKQILSLSSRFCSFCGKAVKWNDRYTEENRNLP